MQNNELYQTIALQKQKYIDGATIDSPVFVFFYYPLFTMTMIVALWISIVGDLFTPSIIILSLIAVSCIPIIIRYVKKEIIKHEVDYLIDIIDSLDNPFTILDHDLLRGLSHKYRIFHILQSKFDNREKL